MDRHIVNLVEKVDRAWVDYSVAKCAYTTYKMSIFYRERNPEIQEWGDKQYHSAVEGLLQQKELLQLLQQRAPIKLPEAVSRVVQFDFLSPDLDRQHREIKDLRAALAAKNAPPASSPPSVSTPTSLPLKDEASGEKKPAPSPISLPLNGVVRSTGKIQPPTNAKTRKSVPLLQGQTKIDSWLKRVPPPSRDSSPSGAITPLSKKPRGEDHKSTQTTSSSMVQRRSARLNAKKETSQRDSSTDLWTTNDQSESSLSHLDLSNEQCDGPYNEPTDCENTNVVQKKPLPFHSVQIRSIPLRVAINTIKQSFRAILKRKEVSITDANPAIVKTLEKDVYQQLISSLEQYKEGRVKRHCDYTGVEISWTPGPRAMSIEGIYLATIYNGWTTYHSPTNVAIISYAVNLAKNDRPIIMLPLIAVCLNIVQESDFQSRKARWIWAYNALCNMAHLYIACCFKLRFNERISKWKSFGPSALTDILDASRTGAKTPEINALLQAVEKKDLYHSSPEHLKVDKVPLWRLIAWNWERVYADLVRIADRYGLSPSEFDYYLTIPSHSSHRKITKRVFYPFYILSRPQAESVEWNWIALRKLASCFLFRKQTETMDPVHLIYWIASYFCKKIQHMKLQNPGVSSEEIAFCYNLDRFGLPIVPWVNHPLRISLCRKQGPDTSTFGISYESDDFDPAKDIDLDASTFTIETIFTNMSIAPFGDSCWNNIRDVLSSIPLYHPFWRVDLSMGNEIWHTDTSNNSVLPMPPGPEFDTALLPIHSLNGPFNCNECSANQFPNAGTLIAHYQTTHMNRHTLHDGNPNPQQDKSDARYWDKKKAEIAAQRAVWNRNMKQRKALA